MVLLHHQQALILYIKQLIVPSLHPPSNPQNGWFIGINDGRQYWFFEDKWRYIQSYDTYVGLFISNKQPFTYLTTSIIPTPTGLPITSTNGLRILPSGQIYFLEGNTVRYITSWAVFAKYHFNPDALNCAQLKVNNISQYTLGAPIY